MGSGKTRIALSIVEKRFLRKQVDRALFVVPNPIVDQWEENIGEWLPFAHLLPSYDAATPGDNGLGCFVINYEKARNLLKELRRTPFDIVIFDESHKLKNHDSKQGRRMHLIAKTIPYRILMTGTPMESHELEFWSQARVADSRIFGDNWKAFREAWTRPSGFMGKKPKLREDRRKEFLDKLATITFVMSSKEGVELPELTTPVYPVKMRGRQERVYRQMENDLVARLPRGQVASAPLVVTQLIRLHQIAGGYLVSDEGETHELGSPKLDMVSELLDDYDEPLVFFARFLWEIDSIADRIRRAKRKPAIWTGRERTGDKDKFDVMVCQVGITAGIDGLQHRSSFGVFYSKEFSRIKTEQATKRLHRDGQMKKTVIGTIVTRNSVDEDLEDSLHQKGDTTETVLQQLLQRRKRL
jgi:SNF2 family DNA or RNA helicase